MNELIVCEEVGFAYKDVMILHEVNLTINRGRNVLITGKSGCGKTTLLNILGGIIENGVIGRVMRNGTSSFVFQKPHLIGDLNVLDNVAIIGCGIRRLSWMSARKEAEKILYSMQIDEELWGLSVDVLSGGQAQRVAIGRGLIAKVDLLLCDEPTGSLDDETAQMIMDLLIGSDMTLVVISHDERLKKRFECVYRLEKGVMQVE